MAREIQGNLIGTGLRIAVVVSRYNRFISGQLVEGALDCLGRHGVDLDDVDIAWTPGAFELPSVAKKMATSGRYDAVICLGAVMRGGTPHFDFVAGQASRGIANVALETGVPTINGVITTETLEQAIDRAGTRRGNRGAEAALSAIELANLFKQIPPKPAKTGK